MKPHFLLSKRIFLSVLVTTLVFASKSFAQTYAAIPMSSDGSMPLTEKNLGVIYNAKDPDSLKLAQAYMAKRKIPAGNLIKINLTVANSVNQTELKDAISKMVVPSHIKAFSLAWLRPWISGNQSITSAISEGLSYIDYTGKTCVTPPNDNQIYNSAAGATLKFRPSMMLVGGSTYAKSLQLAARAGNGDGMAYEGTVYYLKTTDSARTPPRQNGFELSKLKSGSLVNISQVNDNSIVGKSDVLAYQLGVVNVANLTTNRFLEGAYADNLTSYGGRLFDSRGQTSIVAFMNAGASGSFGTVREPCANSEKFPNSAIVLDLYLHGDTLIEAYWKSVKKATEGLFIGEPLARPYYIFDIERSGNQVVIKKNKYTLDGAYDIYNVASGSPVLLASNISADLFVKDGDTVAQLRLPAGATPVFAFKKRTLLGL